MTHLAEAGSSVGAATRPARRVRRLGLLGFGLLALAARCPLALPPLAASDPADGAAGVSRAAWLRLRFAGEVPETASRLVFLVCGGALQAVDVHRLAPDRLLVNPRGELPPAAPCTLALSTTGGLARVRFTTRPAGSPFVTVHDRRDLNVPLPFPDDYFLARDAGTPTGWRTDLSPLPDRSPAVAGALAAMAANLEGVDGWSPITPLSVELSAAPDPASLPGGPEASLDPAASIGLFDLTPGSPTFGERVPFILRVRADRIAAAPTVHSLVLFPGIPLANGGRYGLVVTRQVRREDGEPLAASAFFAEVLGGGPGDELERARASVLEVVELVEALDLLPIPRDDLALAASLTVRSLEGLPDDVLALREDVRAAGPQFELTSVGPLFSTGGALARGTFTVPRWRRGAFLARDAQGRPAPIGTRSLDFVLTLPPAAAQGFAPIVMYQHGNPGSAETEVPGAGVRLAPGGFAAAGFTDNLNREFASVSEQGLGIFAVLLATGRAPEFWLETYGEQLAFLQLLRALGSLDLMPLGAPDGVPDLDPEAIVYEGISYGSNHGQAFVAYAPELRAAALVAGADRMAEIIEHQDRTTPSGEPPFLTEQVPAFVPGVTMPDILVGLALFQMLVDFQDAHHHAALIYREPLEINGTRRRASVLVIEGLFDSFTTNNATRSLAWTLGPIPQLDRVRVRVSYLPAGGASVQANVDAETSAAFVQYVPAGLPIPASPSCRFQREGHFCAQLASEPLRGLFYRRAVEGGAPRIGP